KTINGHLLLITDEFLVSYLEELEALKALQLFNELLANPKIQLKEKALLEILDIINRLRLEYFKIADDYSLGIIRSELHILIAKLFRIKSTKNQILNNRKYLSAFIDFQKLVEEHAHEHTKVKVFAKMMGLSTKTLNNISQHIVNKTAKEFIDDICTNQIKRLLINTEHSIKEIAYLSGFEETTNFYEYFKRQTQNTPEQFRTAHR
ncbi:MAG: helix-turn-helix domain-containing protein, partial [Bacteroidota bacterium]